MIIEEYMDGTIIIIGQIATLINIIIFLLKFLYFGYQVSYKNSTLLFRICIYIAS